MKNKLSIELEKLRLEELQKPRVVINVNSYGEYIETVRMINLDKALKEFMDIFAYGSNIKIFMRMSSIEFKQLVEITSLNKYNLGWSNKLTADNVHIKINNIDEYRVEWENNIPRFIRVKDRHKYLERFENEFFELLDGQEENIKYYIDYTKKMTTNSLVKLLDIFYDACKNMTIEHVKKEDGSYADYILIWNCGYPYIMEI